MASSQSPHTPPISTAPSAATSPSNKSLLPSSNPRSAALSSSQSEVDIPPESASHSSASQGTDGHDDDDESDIEICLSSLTVQDDPTSTTIRSIDNSLASNDRAAPVTLDRSSPLRSSVSQDSFSHAPSAPLQQTIPLPPVADVSQDTQFITIDSESRGGAMARSEHCSESLEALQTSNVYINGLPPHFPEEQLYALASQFGEIRSVRTFTRHVRDNESGYGFVLFVRPEDAVTCIETLRKYRNLHPTLSKAVHKIPGTYSHSQLNLHANDPRVPTVPASSTGTEWEKFDKTASRVELGDEVSFKAKMESLHDPTSTNLYMEGLPLSIDEPTLAALVSPHKISSSRFFQTRLSNPPRIIAFVRFETRSGAEEIIERLHGRMVRGWNDAGSRISVRFADTAEQRELRRTERNGREGNQSPARLTIAQASLLNLHGQELKSKSISLPLHTGGSSLPPPPPPSSLPPPPIIIDHRGFSPHPRTHSPYDYNSYINASPVPHIRSPAHAHVPPFAVDYSLASSRGVTPLPRTQTPVHLAGSPYHVHSTLPISLQSEVRLPPSAQQDPTMTVLLESLRTGGVPYHSPTTIGMGGTAGSYSSDAGIGVGIGHGTAVHHHAHTLGLGSASLNSNLHTLGSNHVQANLGLSAFDAAVAYGPSRATQARGGYTATEEFIMRAHIEAQQQQQQQQQYELRQEQQMRLREEQLLQKQSTHHETQQHYLRRRPPPLDLVQQQRRRTDSDASIGGIGVGVRGYRTQAAAITVPSPGVAYNRHSVQDDAGYPPPTAAPAASEDAFQALSQDDHRQLHQQLQHHQVIRDDSDTKHGHSHRLLAVHGNAHVSQDHISTQQQQQKEQQYHHTQQTSVHQFITSQQQQTQSLSSQQQHEQPSHSPHVFSQVSSPNPNLHHYQQAHLRSMTLPQRRPPSASAQRHYQHSSMSVTVPNSSSLINLPQLSSNMNSHTQTNYSINKGNVVTNENTSDIKVISDRGNIGDGGAIEAYDGADSPEHLDGVSIPTSRDSLRFDSTKLRQQLRLQNPLQQHHQFDSSRVSLFYHHHNQNVYDGERHQQSSSHQTSPSLHEVASPALTTSSPSLELISPALTYSAHTPASTLSPATPFFGSFATANLGQQGLSGSSEQGKARETTVVGVVGMGVEDVSANSFEERRMVSSSL